MSNTHQTYIGLDVGTTGCKAVVFNREGRIVRECYSEYDKTAGAIVINPDEIWLKVKSVVASAAQGMQPGAIAVSSFGESFVPLDAEGNALTDIMLYTDPRGSEQCKAFLRKMDGNEIMRRSGAMAHPMFSLPKMAWLREECPRIFEKTKKFALMIDYIGYRLCGEFAIPYSLAARTLGFDVIGKKWDPLLLSLAGIDETYLSTPVSSGCYVGTILSSVAGELGLPSNLKVIAGGHDQVMAVLGSGATREGVAADGIGTVECITPVFSHPVLEPGFMENSFCTIPYIDDGSYVTYAFNFAAGSLLKWFRDGFAKDKITEAKAKGLSAYALLDSEASKTPTGLYVVPHFNGSGTPEMDTGAKGAIFGLDFNTGISELYRAFLEGATYEMKYNTELLSGFGIDIREFRATGGGSRSNFWLSIKASIHQAPFVPLDVPEAGAAGDAMLCAVSLGDYSSPSEAAECFVKTKAPIEPDRELVRIYEEKYAKYKEYRNKLTK